jgi:hypothetical protein
MCIPEGRCFSTKSVTIIGPQITGAVSFELAGWAFALEKADGVVYHLVLADDRKLSFYV